MDGTRRIPPRSSGTLLALALGLACLAPIARAGGSEGQDETKKSPWTPDRLDVRGDLSEVDPGPRARPDAAETPSSGVPIGPPVAGSGETPAGAAHEHSGDGHGGAVMNQPVPEGPGPRIVWEPGTESVDFGEVVQGTIHEHEFALRNGGDEDLAIHQIKPSCGCTVPQTFVLDESGGRVPYVLGQPIPAGADVLLVARLNTAGKRNRLHSNINIFSNEPRNPVTLGLRADVREFLSVEPQYINFAQMTVKESREDSVTVTCSEPEGVVLSIEEDLVPEEIEAKLTPLDADPATGRATRWELRAKLGPNAPEGRRNYPIRLLTDRVLEGAPEDAVGAQRFHSTTVYVLAQVTGMVTVTPPHLSFGLVVPGQVVERTLRVSSYDPEFRLAACPVSVAGHDGQDFAWADAITTSVEPSEDGTQLEVGIKLEGLPDDASGPFRGVVSIEVGHPSKPTVEVSFTGVCRNVVTGAGSSPVRSPGGGADGAGERDGAAGESSSR